MLRTRVLLRDGGLPSVGCDHAAAVYLLCAPCLDVWREEVAVDLGAAALRIRPL